MNNLVITMQTDGTELYQLQTLKYYSCLNFEKNDKYRKITSSAIGRTSFKGVDGLHMNQIQWKIL